MGHERRSEFGNILEAVLGSGLVYFQPPEDLVMSYPCIVFERDKNATMRADNKAYSWMQGYQVTYIDKSPDSDVFAKLVALEYSEFNRHFATSGLNHDVFVIYH